MTLLAKIVRHKPADLLLAAEALVLLAFFRTCLALVPVRRTIRMVTRGHAGVRHGGDAGAAIRDAGAADAAGSAASMAVAVRVRWAVSAVGRHSMVEFACFPQTLAGYAMLRRRKVPSTMAYGVARSPKGELIAHTWLTVEDRIVLPSEGAGDFSPVERWT